MIIVKKEKMHIEFFISLIIALTAVWIYLPVMNNDFINFDDPGYIINNYHVRQGISIEGIKWAFTTFDMCNWHPFTWMSHMLDCQMYGLNPGKHHLTNLVFHVLNTILLFFVLFRSTENIWPSFFVSIMFAVHPMHVESVAWISERKDVLSTFFMMSALLFYTRYVKSNGIKYYWAAFICFLLGLMSKPMIVTLPFVFLILDYWPLKRIAFPSGNLEESYHEKDKLLSLVLEKVPFFFLSGLSSLITVIAQDRGNAIVPLSVYPLYLRCYNAVISYFEYLKKMFFPVDLALPYPYPADISSSRLFISLFVILLISISCFLFSRKKPYLIIGWSWYLGTLFPVIGLLQVGAQSMADRYTYIPFIGLYIMFFWALADIIKKSKRNMILINAMVIIFSGTMAMTSRQQLYKWSDSVTLFQNTIKQTTGNHIAHNNLGQAIVGRPDIPIEKALEHFQEAVRIKPDYAEALYNLGIYWTSAGNYDKALENFKLVLDVKPQDSVTYTKIAHIYLKNGDIDNALDNFRMAIRINPLNSQAHNGIGVIYSKKGDIDKAIFFFKNSLAITPENSQVKANLSSLLLIKNSRKTTGDKTP